ncbi:MAG TPA: DUF3309 domain-containing protein [Xanthobacteraceae bacterium]|jgi:hypothetical protein|nr:DUF3309 domain-containing protein [Xanthobacteraceae bacterium]
MSTTTTSWLIAVLVLFLVAALPAWPHSAEWGYGPSGLLSLFLIVAVILALSGQIRAAKGKY